MGLTMDEYIRIEALKILSEAAILLEKTVKNEISDHDFAAELSGLRARNMALVNINNVIKDGKKAAK